MDPNIPQKHIDRLRGDPLSAPAFDARYGSGQAARILSQAEGQPAIPQHHIDRLRNDPESAPIFDQKYGAGQAAKILRNQVEPPIPQHHIERLRGDPASAPAFDQKYGVGQAARILATPPDAGKGFVGTAADMAKGAVRGGINTVNETAQAIRAVGGFFGGDALQNTFGDLTYGPDGLKWSSPEELQAARTAGTLGEEPTLPNLKETETLAGGITEGVSQFLTGLAGLGKFTKLAKLDGAIGAGGKIADAAVRSATVSAVAFDPFDGNLANFVERYPSLQNPVTDFLAVKDDDSQAEARLKNALADMVVGIPLDLTLKGLKALRARRQGRLEDAEKHLEELADADVGPNPKTPAEAPAGAQTGTPNVDGLVKDVAGAEGRSASVAKVAGQEPQALPQLPKRPIKLDEGTAKSLTDSIRASVDRAKASENGPVDAGLGDPFNDFFRDNQDFNVNKLLETGGDGVRSALYIMEDIGEAYRPQIDAARGGETRSFETVRAAAASMARMTGNDPGRFLAALVDDAKSMKAVESRLYAYKNFTLTLADSVKRLAQQVEEGVPGKFGSMDALATEFARRAEFLANVQSMTKAVQSGTARAVSAGRLGAKVSPAMTRAIESGNFGAAGSADLATIQRVAKAVASSGSPEEVLKATRMSLADKTGEAVYRFWINSILSGPATHLVNGTSNFVKAAAQTGEEYLAGVYGGNAKQRAVAVRTFAEMAHQTVEAWRVARKALNAGENILDDKALVTDRANFTQVSAEDLAKAIESGQYGAAILKAGHALFNYPTRLLASEDEFFKQISYRARVSAKAQVDGQALGLKGADLANFVEDRMAKAIDQTNGSAYGPDGKPLDEDALLYAQQATFTQPLTRGGFAEGIQTFANRSPWMRLVLPFIKTPTNVLSDWWQRSPLHLQNYEDLAAGGERRAKAAARLTTGAAFYTTAGLLVNSGVITGSGPNDPETKKLWKAAGNQPYSLKVGDKWVAYNRMDPFGMFFGLAADIGDIAQHTESREAGELGEMALMAFSRNLSNKTYLRGLADVMDALFERGPQVDEKVSRLLQSYASGFTPFSGYLNGVKDDPHMREVRSMADAAANRIPGLSAALDPQRNILGEITMASEAGGLSPWAITTDKPDPLAEELVRLFDVTGEKMMKPPKVTGKVDWTEFKNERGQSAYDRFLQLHDELGLRKAMQGALGTPGWARLGDQGRVEIFRSVQSRVRSAARAKLFQEFPELRNAVIEQERLERLSMLRR